MSKASVFLLSVLLTAHVWGDAQTPIDRRFSKADYEFLEFTKVLGEASAADLVREKSGRALLRKFVEKLRSNYRSTLMGMDYNAGELLNRLRSGWKRAMWNNFQSGSIAPTGEAKATRDRILARLPFTLKTTPSDFPEDPYVDDPMFFERLFRLRAPWRSFHFLNNTQLTQVYNQYKKLWMKTHAENALVSDVIFMWHEHVWERIISIVAEWEIHGVKTDEDDIWQNDIPSDVIPAKVLDSFQDDNLFIRRMSEHDHQKSSPLFYGLPVGYRLPTMVPVSQVSVLQAEIQLQKAVQEMKNDCSSDCDQEMNELARVANQYLMVTALDGKQCLNPPTCSWWKTSSKTIKRTDATRVLDCAAKYNHNAGCNNCEQGPDFFSEDSESFGHIIGDQDHFSTRNQLDELLYECMSKNAKAQTYAERYKDLQECKGKLNRRVMSCATRMFHHVRDPRTLLHLKHSKVIKDRKDNVTSCGVNPRSHIQILDVRIPDLNRKYTYMIDDVEPLSDVTDTQAIKKSLQDRCDDRNECIYHTDIEQKTETGKWQSLAIYVDYECSVKSCDPELYQEKTISAYKNEAFIWQCPNESEAILIKSVEWLTGSTFNSLIHPFAKIHFEYYKSGMDKITLEYFTDHCQGRNKCDQIADLNWIARIDTSIDLHLQVAYQCLPCQEFKID